MGSAPGFILPFGISAHFGVGRLTDAYFLGLAMANFAASLFDGVLQANATPVLQNEKRGGRVPFLAAVRKILRQACAASTLSYLALGLAGGILLVGHRSGWTATQRHTCVTVAAILILFVSAVSASSVLSAALYALGDFMTPTSTAALRSVVPLGGLAFIGHDARAVAMLAALMVAGELLRVLVLFGRLRTCCRTLRPGRRGTTVGLWRTAIPHGVSMLVSTANPVVDRTFASPLGPGSVTLLDLGEKVLYAPLTALASLFVIVAGTRWGEIGFHEPAWLRRDFRRTMALATGAAALTVVAVAAIVLGGGRFVGSRFAGANTAEVQMIVLLLLIGLPAGIVLSLGSRFIAAIRQTWVLPLFAVYGFSVNIACDAVGAHLMGVQGIALASSVMRWGDATLYLIVCGRFLRQASLKSHAS